MPDPEVVTPPVETPPAEPTPDPKIAELERQLQDLRQQAEQLQQQAQTAAQLNERYAAELGAARAAAPPAEIVDEIDQALSAYQPQDRAALKSAFTAAITRAVTEAEKRAEKVGYRMLTQAHHQQQLQDPELLAEAQKAYQVLQQNPLWAGASEELKRDRAIAEARANLAVKKAAPVNGGAPQTLPTTGAPRPQTSVPDREKFIKEFVASEASRNLFRHMYKKDPDSEEGKRRMRRAAELKWEETQKNPVSPFFGPDTAVGKAAAAIVDHAKGFTQ